jgi:hypothetical protein
MPSLETWFDEHLSHVEAGDAPCLQVLRLISGFDPRMRSDRWFVMIESKAFQAVLDESGYKAADENDVFVFAGYMGKVADWAKFTHDWGDIIRNHPELEDTEVVKGLVRFTGPYSDHRAIKLVKAVTDNLALGSIRWLLPYREYRSVVVTIIGGLAETRIFIFFFAAACALSPIGVAPPHSERNARSVL